jgi:diguanylate cyclase (GGDEF)-like protein
VSTVLVVDDDAEIARFIEQTLRTEGFDVVVASGGQEALDLLTEATPDLAMLDVLMPGIDGIELVRRLRTEPSTATLPVIMLTAQSLPAEKIAGLTAGADDYLVKPFDTLELIARVRSTLRRNADMRAMSPLTGLPGNHRITEAVAARTSSGEGFAVCHLDLDNFKAFNDKHGWLRGDEVIELLATTLKEAACQVGQPVPFVGHVGGDDFVALCTPEQVELLCEKVMNTFDENVRALYDPDEVAAGYVVLRDRQGHERRYPLTSVSIGVASSERRRYTDPREVVAVATEMKAVAKGRDGSAVAIDRRTDGSPVVP